MGPPIIDDKKYTQRRPLAPVDWGIPYELHEVVRLERDSLREERNEALIQCGRAMAERDAVLKDLEQLRKTTSILLDRVARSPCLHCGQVGVALGTYEDQTGKK